MNAVPFQIGNTYYIGSLTFVTNYEHGCGRNKAYIVLNNLSALERLGPWENVARSTRRS